MKLILNQNEIWALRHSTVRGMPLYIATSVQINLMYSSKYVYQMCKCASEKLYINCTSVKLYINCTSVKLYINCTSVKLYINCTSVKLYIKCS